MDLRPTFEHYYPDGYKGGECTSFAEKLYAFGPTDGGANKNTYPNKLKYFKTHGSTDLSDIQVGDILLLNVGPDGHVCIANDDKGTGWQLTESNWYLDEKVHHDRILAKNNTKITAHLRAPLKVKIMTTVNLSIVSNSPWPDIDKFMSMVKDWSGGRLAINLVNQVSPILPPIKLEDVLGYKQPEHQWLIDNVFQYRKDADGIILNIMPIGLVGENGYCKAPATPTEAFTLFLACGDSPLFTQDYGYSNSTKLALHELSHMLYLITGGVDQTHPADLTAGHALIEAYQQLDYDRLATNLALRRQQKDNLMPQIKLIDIDGEEGIFLAASDLNDLNVLCKMFGKDKSKVEVKARKINT